MGVEVVIDGREAIPVRAIPFVAGWMLSPDVVAMTFAKTDHWVTRLDGVAAYYLSADGKYSPMLAKEWDGIEADLQILSDKLKSTEEVEQENYPVWRQQSIRRLPAGCFVWRNEFEKAFRRSYSTDRYTILDERPGDRELNFSPMIPPELREIVAEGFTMSVEIAAPSSAEKPMTTNERNTLLTIIAALCDYSAIIPAERGTASQVAKMTEEVGAPITDDTIRKVLAKIPDALESRKK